MTPREPAGLRVVVMGLGSFGGGSGAARFLARRGARVLVTDLRDADALAESLSDLEGLDVELALGGHRVEDFERADWVVANPAVRPDHPLLARARASGAHVVTEVGLALDHVPAQVVAVTGTQGKSSTCRMTADLLTASGRRALAGGNLGGSLLDRVDELVPGDVCVVELSSYQLEHLVPRSRADATGRETVRAVALLPVLTDHLERHGTREAYAGCKLRILDLLARGGTSLLPRDLPVPPPRPREAERRLVFSAQPAPGARLVIEAGAFRLDDVELGRVEDLPLPGFQRENALVALGLAHALGAEPGVLAEAVRWLSAPEHRLEDLGTFRGRRVFDNGVSTTPDSTASALADVPGGRCLLLVGGRSKRLSLAPLLAAARRHASLALTFGEAGVELAGALVEAGVPARDAGSLEEAVRQAFEEQGELPILFSPACSSFDAFQNFRARALAFRRALPPRDAVRPAVSGP